MKRIILILSLVPLLTFSQSKNIYKEFNFGIAVVDAIGAFPGASFLIGNTSYYSNNTLLDYQIGVAYPSIFTGKVGFGIVYEDIAAIIGFRPWPTCPYLQLSIKERHNLSIEYHINHGTEYFGEAEALITYGIRF